MARRCPTILLLMAYIASQLVVPHAHGAISENQPFDHSTCPHVHASWFRHEVGHKHHQDCAGVDSHLGICGVSANDDDHDSDAIYLPNDGGVSLPVKCLVTPDSFQLDAPLAIALACTPTTISESWPAVDFPDKCSRSCPLYLALRALRN